MSESNYYKTKVKEVERVGGKAISATIEHWPFIMVFARKEGKVSLISFSRFDESRDEPDWIPSRYFDPAIRIARGIFSSGHG